MEFVLSTFVGDFVASPSLAKVKALKKPELLEVANSFNLDVRSAMRKLDIQIKLVEYYVEEDLLSYDDLGSLQNLVPQNVFELKKLEMELQLKEKLEMERLLGEAKEREKQREIAEKKLENEREERESRERLEIEKLRMENELKMKELELKAKHPEVQFQGSRPSGFDASRHVRLVPPFSEKEVDKYFLHFEKVAKSLGWPPGTWTLLLQSVIRGKAQEAYTALSVEDSAKYETVKEAILKAYELVPEAYRQKFRYSKKLDSQTYVEFAREKENMFNRWCTSKEINTDYEKLRQLILVEEFKRCVPNDIKTHLDEQKIDDLSRAATTADDFALTHKSSFGKVSSYYDKNHGTKKSGPEGKNQTGSGPPKFDKSFSKDSSPNEKKERSETFYGPTCAYCKKKGHVISECWILKRKNEARGVSNAVASVVSPTHASTKVEETQK